MTRRRSPRTALALVVATLLTLATGCSSLGGTGDLNYVAGEGNIVQIAPEDRADPVEISGDTLEGEPLDLADERGQVVVVPLWGDWCSPCHKEAPLLVEAAAQLPDAVFVGMHTREAVDAGLSFQRTYALPYPSLHDEGDLQLGFGRYTPSSTPSTVVLDRQGRVAALVNGAVSSTTTLVDVVEEVEAEDGPD